MLKADKMSKGKDFMDFDKGQIVIATRLGQSHSKIVVGCFPVCSGPRKEDQQNGNRVMESQGSLMHVGNESWPP